MKSFYNLGFLVSVLLCLYSNSSLANSTGQKNNFKELKKVSLKCHVQFVGGKSTILYHYYLPKSEQAAFGDWLLNNYANLSGINTNQKIYKVNECVEIDHKFKDGMATSLEEKLKHEG